MSFALDHIVIAVCDPLAAAAELQTRHGLASYEGGRHPGWGTANHIVPVGDAYLELVAVVDLEEAQASGFGRWIAAAEQDGLRPAGWAVRTTELDAVAERLGLTITPGSRVSREGRTVRWRLAGIEQCSAEPSLPFFIEWDTEPPAAGPPRELQLELGCDASRLDEWLGGPHDLPVRPGSRLELLL